MHRLPPARALRLARRPRGHELPEAAGLDHPSATEPVAGRTVRCTGWAWPFADQRVRDVGLRIGHGPLIQARLTLRPDIAETLDLPEAALSGFEAHVQLPADAEAREAVLVSAVVRGLHGGFWTTSEWTVPVALESQPAAGDAALSKPRGERPKRIAQTAGNGQRDLLRRRLGYDPWHSVVLIEGPDDATASGLVIAALDVIAERHPSLELLIAGVPPDSGLADLLRRTILGMALEDRVTVPPDGEDQEAWRAVADARVDASLSTDLAEMIDRLARLAGNGRADALQHDTGP